MDAVLLARIQFALTVGFHFIFPPLTIGLAWLNVWLLARYRKTGDPQDRALARFWVKLFALSFAVGVASGLTMEFQFGTNWAAYSRFVGDIFGAPLAAEAIFAFFLESVFLGVLVFGWERVSRTTHLVAGIMVAAGATISAFWIIVANSWMQTPAGYALHGHRAVLTDFWGAVFNPSTLPRYLHTVDAAFITGAFFMLGISAWFLLKGRHIAGARRTLTVSLCVAFLASLAQMGTGHYHAVQVAQTQPAKLAAFEGLFETQREAPLLLFGIPDPDQGTVRYAVRIPAGLSMLVGMHPRTRVQGLHDFPREEWPPIAMTFYPFHLMVALGLFFLGFTALGLLLLWLKTLHTTRWYLFIAWLAIPLPFIANELGWTAAEVGRQPWIVYQLMYTRDAISITVPASHILASIIMFATIYGLLFFAWVVFLRRAIAQGPEDVVPPVSANQEVAL